MLISIKFIIKLAPICIIVTDNGQTNRKNRYIYWLL